jgi:hypothetical protein
LNQDKYEPGKIDSSKEIAERFPLKINTNTRHCKVLGKNLSLPLGNERILGLAPQTAEILR